MQLEGIFILSGGKNTRDADTRLANLQDGVMESSIVTKIKPGQTTIVQ